MMKITVYKNVFNRQEFVKVDFIDFCKNPKSVYNLISRKDKDFDDITLELAKGDKQQRNEIKRNYLPAAEISTAGLVSIDIDDLQDKKHIKDECIKKLKKLDHLFLLQESSSGNLVAYFKYDVPAKDFQFMYYKLYLELTLLLSVSIDYLPEVGRLRYLSHRPVLHHNPNAGALIEILDVGALPVIGRSVKKDEARRVIFKSC